MFKTGLCDLLGIKYPIIQGGMVWVSYHELCAAVSEAGGLGCLAGGSMTTEELREQIRQVKEKTKKPFGVNVPIHYPHSEDLLNVAIKEGVDVITTSAGSPKRFTKKIHDAGLKVLHICPNSLMATKAANAGVDAIVAEGVEAGGLNGIDEMSTMALVPQVVKRVNVPVIAAGGIANGNGFVAALALGAQGVQIGTRFAATYEARGHPNFKKAILNVKNTGTVITGRVRGMACRCVRNKLAEEILAAEARGVTAKELSEMVGIGRARIAAENGDIEEGTVSCGQIAGIIDELKSVQEVITGIIEESAAIITALRAILKK